MNRRSFLALPFLVPAMARANAAGPFHLRYDHVIGTSLDITIQTASPAAIARAENAVLREIERLAAVLDTRDAGSEICGLAGTSSAGCSRSLHDVLTSYGDWESRTGGAITSRPGGPGSPLNVDALGKAYIVDRALAAARNTSTEIDAVRVNIGGDIATWHSTDGEIGDIAIANPALPFDNAPPLTRVAIGSRAIATSGSYARGPHLFDPRTGEPATGVLSSTVVANDAVTANALATAACIVGVDHALSLVRSTPDAELLLVTENGDVRRSAGFSRLELAAAPQAATAGAWPAGYRLSLSLNVVAGIGEGRGPGRMRATKRPYLGLWAEEPATNRLVRVIALWADQPRYFGELSVLFNRARRSQNTMSALARATRPVGRYDFMWDGMSDAGQPVAPGTYRIVVETNQEGGTYAKQSALVECGSVPVEARLPGSANFESTTITYGPGPGA